MELPQYTLKTLPVAYRAVLNHNHALPEDVRIVPSLPDASVPFFSMLIVLPICMTWLYVVYNQMFTAYRPGSFFGTIFYIVSSLVALGIAGSTFNAFQNATHAAAEAKNHDQWRFGVFLHREWMLIRHYPSGRIYHIAHHDVVSLDRAMPAQGGGRVLPQLNFDHGSTRTHLDWTQVWLGISDNQAYEKLEQWHMKR
jgi:hypothetical protein